MDKQSRADAFFQWTKPGEEGAEDAGLDTGRARARGDGLGGGGTGSASRLRLLDDDGDAEGGDSSPAQRKPAHALPDEADPSSSSALDRLSLLDAPDHAGEPGETLAAELSDTRKRALEEEVDDFFSQPPVERALDNSAVSRATGTDEAAIAEGERAERPAAAGRAAQPSWEQQKRYERLSALAEQSPDAADPRIRLATVCQEMGRVQEAIKHYRHALRLDPDNAFARARLAELGDLAGASGAFNREAPFLGQLTDALRYPAQSRRGRGLLVGAAVLAGACGAVLEFQPWIGWVPVVAMACALLVLQHQVVKGSIRGGRDLPDWPESFEAQTAMTGLAGALLAAFGLAALLGATGAQMFPDGIARTLNPPPSTSPYPAYLEQLTQSFIEVDRLAPDKARDAARRELATMGVPEPRQPSLDDVGLVPLAVLVLAGLLFVVGAAYYPVAVLIVIQLDSPRLALNYAFGFKQLLAAPVELARLAGASLGALVLGALVAAVGADLVGRAVSLPILGSFAGGMVAGVVVVHLFLSLSYLTGQVYRRIESQLGWFRRPGQPAKAEAAA